VYWGYRWRSARDPGELADHLAAHQPARVRPPGELPAYSNYGLALAGLAAAKGQPFERHIDTTILTPLGMRASTFEPPDSSRAKDLLAPAGGLWSTVGDMGRFLTEHLGGRRVLDTTRMHARAFGTDPRLPGSALGLQEWYHGSTRMLGHGGDGPGSHSALALIPERNAGIFVVFNGDGADGGAKFAARQVVRAWAESLAPRGNAPDGPAGGAGTAPADVAGSYRSTRMNRNDFSELFLLLGSTVTVSGNASGITTTGLSLDPNSTEQHWRPVGDGLFLGENGQLIAFAGDRLLVDGVDAYERMAWYEDPSAHLLLMAIGLLLLATAVAWPVAALWRRRRGPGLAARVTAGVTAGLAVTCVVGLAMLGPAGLETAMLEDAPVLTWVFAPLSLAAVGTLATAGYAVVAWRRHWWTRAIRLHYTAVAVGGLLLVVVSHLYRLTTVPFV
jgi:hypothetical protein